MWEIHSVFFIFSFVWMPEKVAFVTRSSSFLPTNKTGYYAKLLFYFTLVTLLRSRVSMSYSFNLTNAAARRGFYAFTEKNSGKNCGTGCETFSFFKWHASHSSKEILYRNMQNVTEPYYPRKVNLVLFCYCEIFCIIVTSYDSSEPLLPLLFV